MIKKNGFSSVVVIIIVLTVLLMANFFIAFAKNEFETSTGFLNGIIAENLAQAGIKDGFVKLSKDNLLLDKDYLSEKSILYIESDEHVEHGSYKVYLTYKDGQPILLSVAESGKVKRQVVCYLSISQAKTVLIERWDSK